MQEEKKRNSTGTIYETKKLLPKVVRKKGEERRGEERRGEERRGEERRGEERRGEERREGVGRDLQRSSCPTASPLQG
ncbi:hypothetical protein llap_16 [Limosa lapponica baueri]|uniref:Uncharacterized protein n=1 Tax=Limosa lapponica baueri TaxID=1758121 RepID=A0A2I0UUC9_LIMLA|nr:hypothetical protein llap_16 [Limosa lapponica baueri]